jgi:excisionase family DNA binding protein
MTEQLYTTQQFANMLGVTDSYIRILIVEGKVTPDMRIGNTWVFYPATVEAFKQARDAKKSKSKHQAKQSS